MSNLPIAADLKIFTIGICKIKMQSRVLLSLLLILFTQTALTAAEPEMLVTRELVVVYDKSVEQAARQALGAYPGIRQELEALFSWSLDFRPTLVLVNDKKRFQQLAAHELIVAYALPEKNVAVIDLTKMNISPFTLRTTFKHELCHLMLHYHVKNNHLPRWLDEGICQWASDGLADILMDNNRELLPAAILSNTYFDLDTLHYRFPQNKKLLILAYEQSKSVVEYISREYGPEGILYLLELLKQGNDINVAIEKGLSISYDELKTQWREHLNEKFNWFTYLSIHIYEILFVLAALLTILGFARKIVRKRAYSAEDEEDEDIT